MQTRDWGGSAEVCTLIPLAFFTCRLLHRLVNQAICNGNLLVATAWPSPWGSLMTALPRESVGAG
jgi:hypothetical protein